MAEDFLPTLRERLDMERFHIVGRSMGGSIGQLMTLTVPDRIASLAMLASCAKFDPLGERMLTCMREVLELTGSWAAFGRHFVQHFVWPNSSIANSSG